MSKRRRWTGPFIIMMDEVGEYIPFVTPEQCQEAQTLLSDGKDIGLRVRRDAPRTDGESGWCVRKVAPQ